METLTVLPLGSFNQKTKFCCQLVMKCVTNATIYGHVSAIAG